MSKIYFIKNKYVGVKVAKYSQQKDRLHKMQQRRKDEVELIESKIDEEQKAIASLEEEKAKAICAGDQNPQKGSFVGSLYRPANAKRNSRSLQGE